MDREKQIREIIHRLKKKYPKPVTALEHSTPFELLVATILSAQTTDAHVNKVTEGLFRKYPSISAFAEAKLEDLQKDMNSINFYRNKANNIQRSARMIMERFNARVPETMEELITLPGVARKTANIILSNAFGINEGIAVDTHVRRLSGRLGLSDHSDPVKIEKDLMEITPEQEWGDISHFLIFHGRNTCKAKKPDHGLCVLFDICPSRDSN